MAESRHLLLTCRNYSSCQESLLSRYTYESRSDWAMEDQKSLELLWSQTKNIDM